MPALPPVHRPNGLAPQQTRQQRNREADSRRGSARDRGYTSKWDAAAKQYLFDRPLCCGCEAAGQIKESKLVDHILPHRGDMVLFWDRANWQPSCKWHHDVVKQRLERLFDAGLVRSEDLSLSSERALQEAQSARGYRPHP